MSFQISLASPEKLLFEEAVDQVDLPGTEGDFGILSGHAPIVATLRPGIVTATAATFCERFVILGGLVEFQQDRLTILAEQAWHIDDFDPAELQERIDEMEEVRTTIPIGAELDQTLTTLDHYRQIQAGIAIATAF